MARKEMKDIGKIIREGVQVDRALLKASWRTLRTHKKAGVPLVIWRNGRVEWVSPEEFERELRRTTGPEPRTPARKPRRRAR